MKRHRILSSLLSLTIITGAALVTSCASTATGDATANWEVLFQRGDDLSKWKVAENPESVRIEDGYLVCNGKRAHAFYIGRDGEAPSWKNFEAEIEFMTAEGANGGLFFHSNWQESGWPLALECQINATHKDPRKTGSIYALGDVETPGHKDGEWVTMRLKVVDMTATVFVNGKQTNQWTQPEDHNLELKRLREGTFALQAHDPGSVVKIRSLKVRRLP